VTTAHPLPRHDAEGILERLLEDAAGQAGVLAAARDPEVDEADITCALRVLAEHRHATVALWWEWRQPEDYEEDTT
jgi:hypothetical protein